MTQPIDTTTKSSCWSITAFNEDIDIFLDYQSSKLPMPSFIREVIGGLEVCPNTKAKHFQGCLLTTQIRFSQLKNLFPKIHIEKAIKKEALIKYAMKEQTATGPKLKVKNPTYITIPIALEMMADYAVENYHSIDALEGHKSYDYNYIASQLVLKEIQYSALFSNPQMKRAWIMFARVLYCKRVPNF